MPVPWLTLSLPACMRQSNREILASMLIVLMKYILFQYVTKELGSLKSAEVLTWDCVR